MSHPVDENVVRPEAHRAGPVKTGFITLLILLTGVVLIWLIFETEPSATRSDTVRETAMLVDVQTVSGADFRPSVEVMGMVMPAQEITLSSRVGGQVIEQAEAFSPGNRVDEGQVLLRIDPADYRTVLDQRRSELQQAQANLALEEGQQAVALQEFQLLGEEIEPGSKALVLRQPQMAQAKAEIMAAEAAVRQAELDLGRTDIRAPFPARVLSREVTEGSQVSPGQALGRLVGTQQYWVEATVPLSKLQWLDFNDDPNSPKSPVTLRHDTVWPAGVTREGELQQLVGDLDANTRMARVLITVEDPLALEQSAGKPPLILGTQVRVVIKGRPLESVIRLDRNLVRRNDTVWVMEDNRLSIRNVDIAFRDQEYAYISAGLADGDQIITNDLASVVNGARLRLEGERDE
ncbi:efflux RND transporter periplasmic adaptor subunit [Pusillimonas sp. DMV24BSW_D]|uniref:efflux RND transporter periplasmic adaptor subunit n=1 Tax=Neopusillimonas aestuarii TaxID=2716226 RepID=UPI00140B2D4C|nr:efflux RND transporter periplasmic adaptor subunit [Pusillimonas sp. DMV24BSW_D]QIM49778.1 efflux RND transporter periplasmic adaptor subunit [Pusillimonas sp. DMV24BSW_D]